MTAALYTCAWRNPACPHAGQRPKARPARKAWTGTRARHAERSPARVRQQPKVRQRCSIPWMQVWVQLQRLAAVGLFDLDAGVALQGKPRSSKGLAELTCTRRRSSSTGALKTEAAGRGSIVAACTTDDLARVVGTSWVRPRTTREVRPSKRRGGVSGRRAHVHASAMSCTSGGRPQRWFVAVVVMSVWMIDDLSLRWRRIGDCDWPRRRRVCPRPFIQSEPVTTSQSE